ncbi:DNA processing protein [Frondihabitans sp. PhB188]|nr:DNA processing protein [Frondihabitans sp. PhB188]
MNAAEGAVSAAEGTAGSARDTLGAGTLSAGTIGGILSPGDAQAAARVLGRVDGCAVEPTAAISGAIWSCLAEPGDGVAGLFRTVFGAERALGLLTLSADQIRSRLRDAHVAEAANVDVDAALRRWVGRLTEARVRAAIRAARSVGAQLLVPGDESWPAGYADLGPHAPAALWVRGDPARLTAEPGVAIVGSRASSGYGEQVALELGDGLASRGIAVHSGGAYGIDGSAHRAALAAEGSTVAVMAGGVDRFYPAGHSELLARVVDRGAVVAEVPCGTSPSRWRFLQRNRLLAAGTGATVVVEAGERSGALNTATHARGLGRPLGAVPGPITSPSSAGCHRLLGEPEVRLIGGVHDVVGLLRPALDTGGADHLGTGEGRLHPVEVRVLDALSPRRPRTEAEVALSAGLGESEARATLAVLELTGRARERDRGWVAVV